MSNELVLTKSEENLFDRGYCPYCTIYDLRTRRSKHEIWKWCRCCGTGWRRLPGGGLLAEQLTMLTEPCKHLVKRMGA